MNKIRIFLFLLLATLAILPLLTGCTTTKAASAPVTVTVKDAPAATPARAAVAGEELELKREKLSFQKNVEPAGEGRVKVVVTSEPATAAAQVNHDVFVVEQEDISGATTTPFSERELVIPLQRETATGVVTAEKYRVVRLKKAVITENVNVTSPVRTETVEIVKP